MKNKYHMRNLSEQAYYNEYYSGILKPKSKLQKLLYNFQPYIPDARDRILNVLGDIRDCKVLEIGCGIGYLTEKIKPPYCKELTAIDISDECIKITNNLVCAENFEALVMDANDMSYADDTFNVVVGSYVLHHIDIKSSIKEISRVLKPDGIAVFIEPLKGNPISDCWRSLTPEYHTETECPLTYDDIKSMSVWFNNVDYKEYNFLTLFSSIFYSNIKLKSKMSNYLMRYDDWFLSKFSIFKKFAGTVQIVLGDKTVEKI